MAGRREAGRSCVFTTVIDNNGNQCLQTHAFATKYGNSNVETELNKLEVLNMNENGIIILEDGSNPK